ncbi:ribonuclease P protein component [Piscinibacterium candidicorallinum]|uniref:Ribonuclease P protein component n=1 Tax=Piscinibacterium candidicorallinum TaxID=1793872 RepID=A0ABV7H3W3_9BURK
MGRLKSRRLHESAAFAAAFMRKPAASSGASPPPAGVRLRSAHFQVLVQVRTPSLTATSGALLRHRLGLVVAKRHFNHAVDRNRIKRLVRNHFEIERLATTPACDVFVRLTGAGFNPHAPQLHEELTQLWADVQRRAVSLARGASTATELLTPPAAAAASSGAAP